MLYSNDIIMTLLKIRKINSSKISSRKINVGEIRSKQHQSGAVLFVALIMLVVLTMVGLAASSRSRLQERMATNMHISNVTHYAAKSAVNAFMTEINIGDKQQPGHVLSDLRLGIPVVNRQYDINGERVQSAFLDGDTLIATIEPTIINHCVQACVGSSFGSEVGCRYYQLKGLGKIVKNGEIISTKQTVMWAKEITACK